MTNPKKKEKRTIPLRTSGESITKPDDRPSKVLFDKFVAAEKKVIDLPPIIPNHPLLPTANKETDVSPKRDYTKVANSIARDAVPSGLFKGTSKNTYDVLYLRTRGAIVPKRIIKAIQSDLLVWANVSHNTLRAHLKHLQLIGLLKIHYILGDNKGAEYEVVLPEEINLKDNLPTVTTSYHLLPPPTTSSDQNQVGGRSQNLLVGGGGLMPENITPNDVLKTSLKTRGKIDDEPFGALNEVLKNGAEKVSGARGEKSDAENWKLIGELLIMELELAAARTGTVSNAPAFLAEHLRRRFQGKLLKEKDSKPRISVKKDTGNLEMVTAEETGYEAEPLTEEAQAVVLKTFRDFIEAGQRGYIMNLESTYTANDWNWLMENLDN